MSKKVLIVYHSQSGNTEAAAELVAEGVRSVDGAEPEVKRASDASADDLKSCDAVCIGSPDYFSYMAGMMKDFFDRTFYPTQGEVADKPCGIFVTHGGGGRAAAGLENICKSFAFKQVTETVSVKGKPDGDAEAKMRELGATLAKAVV